MEHIKYIFDSSYYLINKHVIEKNGYNAFKEMFIMWSSCLTGSYFCFKLNKLNTILVVVLIY